MIEQITPYYFKAVGDGNADDTQALQDCNDYALAHGAKVLAVGMFKITGKVTIKGAADYSGASLLVYGAPAIAVEVSTGSAANPADIFYYPEIRLPEILNMSKPASGWAGQGIGVRCVNLFNGNVYFGHIRGFDQGAVVTSFAQGAVGTKYFLPHLENNRANLCLTPGDSVGWVNENLFFGGGFHHDSNEGTTISGARHVVIGQATNVSDGNKFYGCSLEGDGPEFHIECAGSANVFMDCRYETKNTVPKVWYRGSNGNYGTGNSIIRGYKAETIVFTEDTTCGKKNLLDANSVYQRSGSSSTGLMALSNTASNGASIINVYDNLIQQKDWTATNYMGRFTAQFYGGKRTSDAFDRVQIVGGSGNASLKMGDGTGAPYASLQLSGGTSFIVSGVTDFTPGNNGGTDLGEASLRWNRVYMAKAFGAWGATPPTAQPAVTGSKASGVALANLISVLASYGLLVDGTIA